MRGLCLLVLLLVSQDILGQRHCGTVQYQEILLRKNIIRQDKNQFENWLKKKIDQRKASPANGRTKEIITIPVVVHIVHNGESIGVGRNIPDAQIQSQIDVLNEDFRRLNADASNTPSVFQPVAADIEIQFAMAQRDPEGLPTNGIVRVNGNREEWLLTDNYDLKTLSNWPTEDYLNMWVTAIGGDLLGYAQFPVSDELGGLEIASSSALTDGIVMDFRAFGSIDKYPPANLSSQYNLGRTTTHEVGHYLGLRHTWGDGGCNVDDFCNDTPNSSQRHLGLGSPCTFPNTSSCGSDDMFQNYMAFTDDVCMNLFTEDQKTRIRTVLDNSPRRLSLKTSLGAQPPLEVANNLGIRNIISPLSSLCDTEQTPVIEVRNYGTNTITSAQVQVLVNNIAQETLTVPLNLEPLDIQDISFSPLTITGNSSVAFRILQTNNTTDGDGSNNTATTDVTFPSSSGPVIEIDFNVLPAGWEINNLDDLFTWEITSAPNAEPGNTALYMDFFNYENDGDLDLFTSPLIDLSREQAVSLTFDVSYARFNDFETGPVENEALLVTVSDDCSDPLTGSDTLYFKLAEALSTVGFVSRSFVPDGAADWRRETIDLSAYAGSSNVRISFIARNGFGNNLYLDNISLVREPFTVIQPSLASCVNEPSVELQYYNSTSGPVNELTIIYQVDNRAEQVATLTFDPPIPSLESVNIILPVEGALSDGPHTLFVNANLPEIGPVSLSRDFVIDNENDILPLKETFDQFSASDWFIVNPDNDITWAIDGSISSSPVIVLDAENYSQTGERDWLVSPILDFRNVEAALLNFDLSYSNSANRLEGLSILVSTDCGENFSESVFSRIGPNLSTGDPVPGEPLPFDNITVDLQEFIGEEEVRVAFVSSNDNGDPIYLDNIQIFVTNTFFVSSAQPIFPNPTLDGQFNLLFDLEDRETVFVGLYDAMGHILSERVLPNTLNQTYTFDLGQQRQGIYIVKVRGESFSYTSRVMKGN